MPSYILRGNGPVTSLAHPFLEPWLEMGLEGDHGNWYSERLISSPPSEHGSYFANLPASGLEASPHAAYKRLQYEMPSSTTQKSSVAPYCHQEKFPRVSVVQPQATFQI